MPEDTNPAGAPATGATGQPPGATSQPQSQGPNDPYQPPATGGQQTPPTTGDGGTDIERRIANMEEAMRRMGGERDEARRLLEEERRKNLSPEERQRLQGLDEQVKKAAEEKRQLVLRYEIATRAARLGLVDPDLAVVLLEKSDTVTVSETGQVAGLDEALKQLIKERPYMVKAAAPADAGAGAGGPRPQSGSAGMNDIIRGAARRVTIREG